jgi:hypothetical protein
LELVLDKGMLPLLALTDDGEVAGSVVPLTLEIILRCISKGRKFDAHVISKAGGACKVRILPRG